MTTHDQLYYANQQSNMTEIPAGKDVRDLPIFPERWDAATILETARLLVSGDRAATHGDKLENHQNIAALWSAYTGHTITCDQVAIMMVLLKIARTKLGALNRDDYLDMAGYAGVAAEIVGKLNGR